jgi:GGDEF domain-containing protein
MIILVLKRVLTTLLVAAAAAAAAAATVPTLTLDGHARLDLGQQMSVLRLDAASAVDPDALWAGRGAELVAPARHWQLDAGKRWVGRVTLKGASERASYVVTVPAPSIDDVRIWYREGGAAWQSAVAGDRVPLSRWPFAAQFPAFVLTVQDAPVDLIVAAANTSLLPVAVSIRPDAEFRAGQIRNASLSGMVMGMGAMVSIVCLLGALTRRQAADWLLAAACAWTLLGIACVNGYMAVWFTSEAAGFNDASKPFVGVTLAGLLLALTAQALDGRYLRHRERVVSLAVPALCLAWAVAQALWLPAAWRQAGTGVLVALATGCSAALCVGNARRGGRYVALVSGAVACLALVWVVVIAFRNFSAGVDLRSALVGVLLYAALLLFRQAVLARDRYGRDVLGRAMISAHRDPLTALLSYPGFELAHEEILLRQAAGAQASSMMLFLLPGLKESNADHGFVLTERALVRFAAALQAALGNAWSIARLSKTRFACISTQPYDADQVRSHATRVLARCTRIQQPLSPLEDFDLRIACLHQPIEVDGLKRILQQLERAALSMPQAKRIAFL